MFGDIIQRAEGSNGVGTTTAQASFPSPPTPGNLLVAVHMTGAADSADVSNGTNSYTLGLACPNGTENDWVGLYWRIAGASEPQTVTATSSASDENAIQLIEIEGPFASLPVDIALDQGRQGSGTSYAIGPSGTTAQDDEVAVAFAYTRETTNDNGTASWSDSFVRHTSLSDEHTDFKSVHNATKLLTATGTVGTTLTVVNSAVIQGGLVTFKRDAGAALGLASEADTAPATGRGKTRAAALATSGEAARAVAGAKTRGAAIASESESALGVTAGGATGVGGAGESDAARPVDRAKRAALEPAAETDTAPATSRAKLAALGLAGEIATAQIIVPRAAVLVGRAAELDTGRAAAAAKARAAGLAAETGSALALEFGVPDIPGLEYTVARNRLHYTAGRQLHFAADPNRLHYASAEED